MPIYITPICVNIIKVMNIYSCKRASLFLEKRDIQYVVFLILFQTLSCVLIFFGDTILFVQLFTTIK